MRLRVILYLCVIARKLIVRFIIMLYKIVRFFVQIGLRWYITHFESKQLNKAAYKDPSLIVSNHPNSLFDALVIAVYAPVEIRYLTRGDLFQKAWLNVLLRGLFMLPIYKRSDDPEYEVKNDFTYDECIRLLQDGKHILIFPEGQSHNLWSLQKFMPKGITNLIQRAIEADIPIQIQPYTINYSSFDHVPKAVQLEACKPIDCTDYIENNTVSTVHVIEEMRLQIANRMTGIPLETSSGSAQGDWLRIPAKIGYYTQFWFYRMWRDYIRKKTEGTIFYDSLLFGVLLLSYPVFVLLCSLLIGNIVGFWAGLFIFIFLPFTSFCMAQHQKIRMQTDIETAKVNRL